MNISDLLSLGIKNLKKTSPTPELDTEVLLTYILKKSKEFIYTNLDKEISSRKALNDFLTSLRRREKREPVAYITGHKEFYGLDFHVNKSTLLPRPETELIIDEVVKAITQSKIKPPINIADIGTGSGCIAVALAKILQAKIGYVYATDLSKSDRKSVV